MSKSEGTITISRSAAKKFVLFLLVLAAAGAVVMLGVKYNEQRKATQRAQEDVKRLSEPGAAAKETEDKLINEVKQVAQVPDDERPQIARVDDASKLGVPGVENGDMVLLYPKARRQIIYRQSAKKVIVAVNVPETTQPAATSTEPAPAQ